MASDRMRRAQYPDEPRLRRVEVDAIDSSTSRRTKPVGESKKSASMCRDPIYDDDISVKKMRSRTRRGFAAGSSLDVYVCCLPSFKASRPPDH